MKYRVVVSAVIYKDGKVLLGQRKPDTGPYPNTWQIPGGGIDLGDETTEEAIEREISEETGLKIKNLKKIQWNTDKEPDKHGEETYYIFLVYSCDYESGDLKPDDDMIHFEWVNIDKLNNYELPRPSIKLFTELGYLKKP